MATYYEPLDVDFYEIRMLSILPATTPDAVVKCTLEKTSLLAPPKYVALSYCWGDPDFTTTIFVNDIEVNVTVNLADALQRLRLLEVTRVWADALCINQSDRQERSLQIRHMKHIYTKADDTYSWLGRNDADSSKIAMEFLQNLLLAEDGVLPTDLSNVHSPGVNCETLQPTTIPIISEVLAPTSIEEDIAIADAGERSLLETLCRALLDFFQRPYWKRRWIIQEIAVSPRVQIICDGMRMTLHEMEAAVRRCRNSCYWSAETETAYLFVDRILQFRHDHQSDMKSSLCRMIYMTQESLSTDPRDRIFALLSLCHDGPELVPTPNYRQPLVSVVADISKALLRKKKYCEVVLINRLLETGSNPGPLSLWISDEATKDVAESDYPLVNKQPDSMGELCMLETSRKISLFLQVEGVMIGTIVAATSILGSGDGSNSDRITSGSLEEMLLTDQSTQPNAYYVTSAEIAAAITSCLTQRYACLKQRYADASWYQHHLRDGPRAAQWVETRTRYHDHFSTDTVLHAISLYLAECGCEIPGLTRPHHISRSLECGDDSLVTHGLLVRWLEANASFLVQGMVLKDRIKQLSSGLLVLRRRLLRASLVFGLTMCLLIYIFIRYCILSPVFGVGWFIILPLLILAIAAFFYREIILYHDYNVQVSHLGWKISSNMPFLLETPRRLIRSDKGAIGMACGATELGDKICLLAGRTSPIILRKVGDSDRLRYMVVGDIYVHMSQPDLELYNGFIDQQIDDVASAPAGSSVCHSRIIEIWGPESRSQQCVFAGARAKCTDRYREEGILQTFHLV